MCCLRFLREFEKWSWLGKIGKNEEKWGKMAAPESANIHYLWGVNLPHLLKPCLLKRSLNAFAKKYRPMSTCAG